MAILVTDVRYEGACSLLCSAVAVDKSWSLAKLSEVIVLVFSSPLGSLKQNFCCNGKNCLLLPSNVQCSDLRRQSGSTAKAGANRLVNSKHLLH